MVWTVVTLALFTTLKIQEIMILYISGNSYTST